MNMSEPTVTVVKDADGNVHYYGVGSKQLRDGLADGSLTPHEEAGPGEAKVPADSGDHDTGTGDGEPSDGSAGDGAGDGGDGKSTDKPKPRR